MASLLFSDDVFDPAQVVLFHPYVRMHSQMRMAMGGDWDMALSGIEVPLA